MENKEFLIKIENLENEVKVRDEIIKDLRESIESITKDAYRTLDLNFRLADSEEKLKNLNAQKDKFFSIIAHDLRGPIVNFKESTSILTESGEKLTESEQSELLNQMTNSAKQLFSLLENLLEWSRSQTGRIPFVPTNENLAYLVDDNISLLENSAKMKNINLSSEVDDEILVYVDMNMITTVIRNLIANAIKFTPEGGNITLKAKKVTPFVHLLISDTGVGISPENIDKLFKIDVYTSTPGTNQEKGTGLGLVLCNEFIEKHGGSIFVESEKGKGSTFKILLPQLSDSAPIPDPYVSIYSNKEAATVGNRMPAIVSEFDINDDIKIKLPEIINELNNKYSVYYEEAIQTLVLGKIRKFAQEIFEYASNLKFELLMKYGEDLTKYTDDLELEKINVMLNDYPKIIKALKSYNN